MSARRCHCGSEMIPLFNFFACKAECDLPPSMRTKPKAAPAAKLYRPNVSVSFGGVPCVPAPATPLWVPAVGDWVRVKAGYSTPQVIGKVAHVTTGLVQIYNPSGVFSVWNHGDVEPWVPKVGERATVATYHATGTVLAVQGDVVMLEVFGVSYSFAMRDLEPAP